MPKWAKCKECGGEVVFDAWIHLGGAVHSAYENNLCTECEGKDVDYTEEDDTEEGRTA
jgi:hypothetical protein